MRVLFAIAHLDKGGGQAVQCRQLVAKLAPRVDGEFLALSSLPPSQRTPDELVRVVGDLRFPSGLLRLKRAIAERMPHYDLLQVFDAYYSLPAARLARAHPIVVRSGAHPVEDLASRYGPLARVGLGLLNPWLYSETTIVVNAHHLAAAYRPRGTVCIPNGVDTARFPPTRDRDRARRDLGLPDAVPIVAYTGKIIPRKNVEELYGLARSLPDVHLLLVGNDNEPYYGDRYHREIRGQFPDVLSRVHSMGEVSPQQIPRYLEAADVFVFPSRLEGMPNSMLEAMAAGLPVVAADSPAHREVITSSEVGWLYGSPAELASVVRSLLDEPARATTVGEHARRLVERDHSLDAAAQAYLRLYASILERKRPDRTANPAIPR